MTINRNPSSQPARYACVRNPDGSRRGACPWANITAVLFLFFVVGHLLHVWYLVH